MNSGLLYTVHMQREQWSTRRRRRRRRKGKGKGRRLTYSRCLVATRRFSRWLNRLRWKEWWPVSVASEGRRKVVEKRGLAARSLYEVVGWFLVMEMEVFNPVVTKLVVERRSGEREVLLEAKTGCWKLVFWLSFDQNLSPLGVCKSHLFIGGGRGTLCLFYCQISALGSTRKHSNHCFKEAMMNCQFCAGKWPVGLATLGRCRRLCSPNSLY